MTVPIETWKHTHFTAHKTDVSEGEEHWVVEQSRGQDSGITMYFSESDRYKLVRMETSQSLMTDSERSWRVKTFLERWAYRECYHIDIQKYGANGYFNEAGYSSKMVERVLWQIKKDPQYQIALEEAKTSSEQHKAAHGQAITQLKDLTYALERQVRVLDKDLELELLRVQKSVLEALTLPEGINELGLKRLYYPNYPINRITSDSPYQPRKYSIPEEADLVDALVLYDPKLDEKGRRG